MLGVRLVAGMLATIAMVLPFCVCRALVDNWQEIAVPNVVETRQPRTQGPQKVPAVEAPARRATDTAVRVAAGGAPNPALASANFVSWDKFTPARAPGHVEKIEVKTVQT
eukprot:Skav201001  [mRNA]  locus=scaffold991:200176:203369:+ [translate_table: standard]